jgi:hypothetical protein
MEILQQLEEAQSALEQSVVTEGPPIAGPQMEETPITGAGSEQAKHLLVDHFFTSTVRRLWAFAGGAWRYHNIASAEEEGLGQVAFAADRVDVSWNDSNVLTFVRCWRTF